MSAGTGPSSARARPLRAVAIVPARLASTRLARKMLLDETGRALFEHTVENARATGAFARVVVATDAAEVRERAERAGIEAVTTRADHPSGTDRVEEAWRALAAAGVEADVVVGVQGDEPELDGGDLARLVRAFEDPGVEIATLAVRTTEAELALAPQSVKVVCDRNGDALYFSRALIPARGHARAVAGDEDARAARTNSTTAPAAAAGPAEPGAVPRRHVGVYAFVPGALARFCALPRGALEAHENLEQLRWLEAGGRIRVVEARHAPLGIDTRADYDRFVERCRERGDAGSGPGTRAPHERDRRERAQTG